MKFSTFEKIGFGLLVATWVVWGSHQIGGLLVLGLLCIQDPEHRAHCDLFAVQDLRSRLLDLRLHVVDRSIVSSVGPDPSEDADDLKSFCALERSQRYVRVDPAHQVLQAFACPDGVPISESFIPFSDIFWLQILCQIRRIPLHVVYVDP